MAMATYNNTKTLKLIFKQWFQTWKPKIFHHAADFKESAMTIFR
jgi:hypothetical protein